MTQSLNPDLLLQYNPATGEYWRGKGPTGKAYREANPAARWMWNPWTGRPRDPRDVESDPFGLLIVADSAAPMKAAPKITAAVPRQVADHPLFDVLLEAIKQAMHGKGERHGGAATPFLEQQWVSLANTHGTGFLTGQAAKKLNEAAAGKSGEEYEREVLGAIVYAGMAILHARGRK